MDDITGYGLKERSALKEYSPREFEMKYLGPVKHSLGIEVSQSNMGIFPCQKRYTLDLLQEIGMSRHQPIDTLIEEGLKLYIEPNQVLVDKGRFQRLVGKLMYLAHIRSNLAYALNIVSQYMNNPREQHMNIVICISRYLKSSPRKGILFTKNTNC